MDTSAHFDSNLDLVFERHTSLTPSQLWQGWTQPETLMEWFCPRPWKVTDCRIDLKAGGEFFTVMQGPQGERMENHGCYLEIIQNQKLVWTGMMTKGFRPVQVNPIGFGFVATLHFSQEGKQSLYKATVAHASPEDRRKHLEMGFQEGWGIALKQLEELYRIQNTKKD